MNRINSTVLLLLFVLISPLLSAQIRLGKSKEASINVDYANPKKYEIGGIEVTGIQFLEPNALISVSGLKIGDEIDIPGPDITNALKKLWDQGILGDAQINVTKTDGKYIFLEFQLKERPRLSKFNIRGVKKGEASDIREKIHLIRGRVVTDALVKGTQNTIKKHFNEKGFLNTTVTITQVADSALNNSVVLRIDINKKRKVKINEIYVFGNDNFKRKTVLKKLKETKQKNFFRIFKASKFVRTKFEEDKENLLQFYNKNGFRDVQIVEDSIWQHNEKTINLRLTINEGTKYYFRKIDWEGNYLYDDKYLSSILGIKSGDVYNMDLLEKKLTFNPNGFDISSLYMDDGYLFFQVEPNEVSVEGDSIDVVLRMNEGPQATIKRVNVQGNTKTNDHVILREIRTMPGQKFSRADLIRTQRELSTLGYFDPEKIGINPVPNMDDGTVDINYSLEEKPSDQIELSGGWGGFFGFVGTMGLSFNNFSARRITKLSEWSPLPSGDGQRLAVRFQANGRQFQTYSLNFTEPWFGGKKPNSFSVGASRSVQRGFTANNVITSKLAINGMNVSLGKRLRWPDDYFSILYSVSVQQYELQNTRLVQESTFTDGFANSLNFITTLSRNSVNNPMFPTSGSNISLSMNLTPPYSAFRKNKTFSSDAARYKWIEFHKWNFDASWFTPIAKNLVLNTRSHYGFLGNYNSAMGIGPFERFKVGGDGITGFNFIVGFDVIGLRGYGNNAIAPRGQEAGIIFNKHVVELRYAVSTNPAATIYVHTFAEAGNNWGRYRDYNPFNVYRSAGMGIRIFMPAFGLLGVDWGYGFDRLNGSDFPFPQNRSRSGIHFIIGQQLR
jgi:outer membrane protein insertion porin family